MKPILLQITPNNVLSGMDRFKDQLIDIATKYGMQILGALAIIIIGFLVVRWLGNGLQRWLDKQPMEPPIRLLLVRIARLVMMLGVLVAAMESAGFPVAPMVAGIGVAGVGVGLALQGVLGNLVAGLTIIFTKPFRVGEYIEINNVNGQVQSIELFSTTLLHTDLSKVIVPNRKIVGEILHNYGGIRQLNLSVGVGYGSNMIEVLALAREIVTTNPRVLKEPAPGVGIASLADSSINIAVRPWTKVADFGPAQAEIYQTIIDRFRAQKIEIPFPQREVRLLEKS